MPCTRPFILDAGAGDDVGDAPGVLIEVLSPLESVAADGHAVVGGVDDVGVVEFSPIASSFLRT